MVNGTMKVSLLWLSCKLCWHRVLVPRHSRTCLACKGMTETQRRLSTGRQPGRKSASRPVDNPLIGRGSTASFVPPLVYIRFRLFVLLGRRSGDLSSLLLGVRGRIVP